jgi:hypothetical protein
LCVGGANELRAEPDPVLWLAEGFDAKAAQSAPTVRRRREA